MTTLIIIVVVASLGGYLLRKRFEPHSTVEVVSGRCSAADVRLDAEQMANAATIAAVGLRRGVVPRAIAVALAVALQESKLRNLDHQGKRNDHDSIGLFQQRPSQGWGSEEQILDPRYAADRFYTALLRVKGWEKMRVTEAGQRVQRSAYPEAYQKWAADAEVLASAFAGQSQAVVTCTADEPPGEPTIDAVERQLTRDFARKTPKMAKDGHFLRVPAEDPTTAWQFAHWLVAHSPGLGITTVTVAGRRWSPGNDPWQLAATPPADANNITVQIAS
ncbi:MAG TPA: hypothetical protein VFC19_22980 [Candidatus Limnocylindrales bacterium]|nr:hypothetical protein [Candidatus Limnocylindrales bacterium]